MSGFEIFLAISGIVVIGLVWTVLVRSSATRHG